MPKPREDDTVEIRTPVTAEPKKPEPIESTISALTRSASEFKMRGEGGKGKKTQSTFLIALIVAGIVALLMAVLGIMAVFARRKAAKLQHKLNVQEEEAIVARTRAKQEKNQNDRAELEVKAKALEDAVDDLRERRDAAEDRRNDFEAEIRGIVSWDEVEVTRAGE